MRCCAGTASTNWPSIEERRHPRDKSVWSESDLYCVSTFIRSTPELAKFESTMSMMRKRPPNGTAGFALARSVVRACGPRPRRGSSRSSDPFLACGDASVRAWDRQSSAARLKSIREERSRRGVAQALAFCRARLGAQGRRPLLLGISGPQGGGKSTLAAGLVAALGADGLRALAVSIDDFYLTHQEQQALASRYPGNRYLAYRGYPGTHDVSLGTRTLDALI